MAKLGDMLPKEKTEKMQNVVRNNPNGTYIPGNRFQNNHKPMFDTSKFPTWVTRLTLLCKNNAEFRRLLTLSLIQLHREAGDIEENQKAYIKIGIRKYALRVEGLAREYSFNTTTFFTACLAAIVAFDKYAQVILGEYAQHEVNFDVNDDMIAKANALTEKINIVPAIVEDNEEEE